jgi:hypothetical protein
MDGYYSAAILARISAFAEMLSPGAETTPITRDGSAQPDAFSCGIFTRRNHYVLSSASGLVRLSVQELDSREPEPVLLCEVEAADEHACDALRFCVAAVEAIAVMRAQGNGAGLTMMRRLLNQSCGSKRLSQGLRI